MFFTLILLIFSTLFLTSYMILSMVLSNRMIVQSRLNELKETKEKNNEYDELNLPFFQRVIRPIGNSLSEKISNATPRGIKTKINEKLTRAGNPFNLGVNQWLLIKCLFSIIVPGMFIFILVVSNNIRPKTIGSLVIIILISYLFPNLILNQIIKKRKKKIINSLPDVLDLLTVSVEAGLAFDGAISKLIDKTNGPISQEFSKVLSEIRIGRTRREALKDMSERCDVMDLTTFIGAIIQADELGVSISNVLRIQSVQMRQKRRQRAQEKAMKAPVKMLFPLVFFIFPTLFAVLLGPAIIKIMNEFIK